MWLANMIPMKKLNGKWQMFVDFTDLNKACPKDRYSFPFIDRLVNSTSGYTIISFLDDISRYHHILIEPKDAKDIAFITNEGIFYYKVMPFRLKNARTTY